jgi:hypothetical protein
MTTWETGRTTAAIHDMWRDRYPIRFLSLALRVNGTGITSPGELNETQTTQSDDEKSSPFRKA